MKWINNITGICAVGIDILYISLYSSQFREREWGNVAMGNVVCVCVCVRAFHEYLVSE